VSKKQSTLLIVTEKPSAAKKIAEAISNGSAVKKTYRRIVPYYEFVLDGKKIYVGAAVGHLFNLDEKEKKGWKYPVFDIAWKPSYEKGAALKYTKAYVDCLKKLAKEADSFLIACDLDQEGELIGYNILRYICDTDDAQRMEFSTLTKVDLQKSYASAKKHINKSLAVAGETRHILDHYWGINLSRALSLSIKAATGTFRLLSTGRVQGPALHLLYDKEQEINAFVAEPYWTVGLDCGDFVADHVTDKFWKKSEASKVVTTVTGAKEAIVDSLTARQTTKKVPFPFDLTSMQIEAHRVLHISPKRTLSLAQELYTGGWISYPRTSSQKLPSALGFKGILQKLAKKFPTECKQLLGMKSLKPHEGKKTDPAHPAIYPTGDLPPKDLDGKTLQLYELVCRRFFAVFGSDATRETVTAQFDCHGEKFHLKGTRTVDPGWFLFYEPFVQLKDVELPAFTKGDSVSVRKVLFEDKETLPPKRYSEASLVKELEKRNLGTKATRANIIDNLYSRHYVADSSIRVTELGMKTVEILEKYCSAVVDERLTREFEEEIERIIDGTVKPEVITDRARKVLVRILTDFKKHEKDIGSYLGDAVIDTIKKESLIGACPSCKKGTVHYRKGKFGLFIACSEYPDCKFTVSIPSGCFVKGAQSECLECGWPEVTILRKRRSSKACINLTCKTKDVEIGSEKNCPKCNCELAVRKTLYGGFVACSGYPKCRYIVRDEKD